MRLRAVAFAIAAFAAAGAGAWQLAQGAVTYVEARTRGELVAALEAGGQDWASVAVDGLSVTLAGEAPDEASRLRAIEIVRQGVDSGRLHDAIRVASARPLDPPAFALELLRNEAEVSLIGLAPEDGARATLVAGLAAAGIGGAVTDMLETADQPAPPGWDPALAFGLEVVAELPRAKIQIVPGAVTVTAVAEDEAARQALADALEAAAPEGVALDLEITAPRAVIAPFTVAFRRLPDGAGRLVVCSAESEEDAAVILDAARAAGLTGDADCRLGLGAPSPAWAEAAARGIAAVAEVGGGSFTLTDIEAVLTGPPDLDPVRLAAAGAALGAELPAVFSLATRGAARVATEEGEEVDYAPEFQAVLLDDGSVRLAGPVANRTSQLAIIGFAEALFGHDNVMNTTVLDSHLPEGWPGRVLAGIEALSLLEDGRMAVTHDAVAVSGRSLVEEAGREIEAFFAKKGNGHVLIDVAFDPAAAAAADAARASKAAAVEAAAAATPDAEDAVAGALPAGEVCAEEIAAILAEEMILFEIGSATIDAESGDVVGAIAAVLEKCPGARFEISGHTDSIGRAALNQRLSESRAAAVVAALEAEGARAVLEPRGYGPDRPVADNDTAEGRALNRRIEFALLGEAGAEAAPDPGSDGAVAAAADADGTGDEPD